MLVVPTVICSSVVAERIAAAAGFGTALPHLAGCGQLGPDMRVTHDTLAARTAPSQRRRRRRRRARLRAGRRADAGRDRAAPRQAVGIVAIQAKAERPRHGEGRAIAQTFAAPRGASASGATSSPDPVAQVRRIGLHVGLASNPALGRVTDRLVDLGGSAVLGEIAEIMGAEHVLAARDRRRDRRPADSDHHRVESEARALGLDIRGTQPSPGNIRGGLTTIEEKSLGATHKGGERAPLEDVVGYAAPITRKGLTVMDTPGLDVESVTGMVGGGAQVVVFTTGLGRRPEIRSRRSSRSPGNARTAPDGG